MKTTTKTLTFPSVEWFAALRSIMNTDELRFKELGTADVSFGVQVDDEDGEIPSRVFRIVFEDWVCISVAEVAAEGIDLDFVMEADFATWQEMIENIEEHGHADLRHTLNFLALPGTPLYVNGRDALGTDCFARFNQTLQEFFDSASRLHSEFAFG